MNNNLYIFVYTMKEYQRFSRKLCCHELTDSYTEEMYVQVNTKLILLRKYGSKGQPVFIEEIIREAKEAYPYIGEEIDKILTEYHRIVDMDMEQILVDGTKLNLYETIEDVMYGLYLHADANRIQRLTQTDEQLRFVCIRKYVEDFENVLFKTVECLEKCGVAVENKEKQHASIIAVGKKTEDQNVKNSPFWCNIYGHDANITELNQLYSQLEAEDQEIILRCIIFLEELRKENSSERLLDQLIFTPTKKDWGDYSEIKRVCLEIKNPGISYTVRYNKQHTMAYVRVVPNLKEPLVLLTP